MKKTSIVALSVGLGLAGTSPALAQAPQTPPTTSAPSAQATSAFIDVNGGGQIPSRSLATNTSFPLYGETANISAAQNIPSGFIFDIRGGYRWRKFGVAVGFTTFSRSSNGALAASIPNPIVFNKPAIVNVAGSGLQHSEYGTHVMAVWFIPFTEKMDFDVFAGPSFIHLSQDVMTATVPPGTQTANVATINQSGTAKGGNVGANVNIRLARYYGVGGFVRYAGGSVDIPAASGVKVGGFQIGGGLRLRF